VIISKPRERGTTTIETADGNVFYLIVDRERTTDNVYLLNAVTENDLASLAKPGDGKAESAVPTLVPSPTVTPEPEASPEPTPVPVAPARNNTGSIVFIVIAAVAAGGAGFYFKILRPKQAAANNEDYEEEPEEDDDIYGDDAREEDNE
jgi:hypothetical protein